MEITYVNQKGFTWHIDQMSQSASRPERGGCDSQQLAAQSGHFNVWVRRDSPGAVVAKNVDGEVGSLVPSLQLDVGHLKGRFRIGLG
jgi:hypothetical protein